MFFVVAVVSDMPAENAARVLVKIKFFTLSLIFLFIFSSMIKAGHVADNAQAVCLGGGVSNLSPSTRAGVHELDKIIKYLRPSRHALFTSLG